MNKRTDKQKILDLISSQRTENIKLAMELMKSQNIELPNFERDCRCLHKKLNGVEFESDLEDLTENLFTRTTIDLSEKDLEGLPNAIRYYSHLEYIRLCDNQLKELPDWLPELEGLCLHANKGLDVSTMRHLERSKDSLRILCLKELELTEIPELLSVFSCLEGVILQENQIPEIPSFITKKRSLKFLSLSNNLIREVPSELGNLSKLEWLFLSDNQLRELPDSLRMLQNLEQLDLENNELTEVPSFVFELPNLSELKLSGNPIPETAIALAEEALPNCSIEF